MGEKPRNFPEITRNQVAVLMAEAATGIILLPTGERMLGEYPKSRFQHFESLEDARGMCEERVKSNPKVEFLIFDWEGEYIEAVRARNTLPDASPKGKRSFWKRLLGRR